MNQDAEHLRLLSIFHYVVGGITAVFACIPLIHVGIGLAMLFSPEFFKGNGAPPPEVVRRGFGVLFTLFGGVAALTGWTISGLLIAAGRCLARRRRYGFCQVAAGIGCVVFPFGTVLGVMTLIVLSRPSVRELFQSPPAVAR